MAGIQQLIEQFVEVDHGKTTGIIGHSIKWVLNIQSTNQTLPMKYLAINITLLVLIVGFTSCGTGSQKRQKQEGSIQIVATTAMITDLLENIGGGKVEVNGIMGPGIDPHLYKASESDVGALYNAQMIFYNGLHLEGKLVDIFEKMEHQGA